MTFKTTDIFLSKLEHLVDKDVVDEKEWSGFMRLRIRTWRFCIFFSVILL